MLAENVWVSALVVHVTKQMYIMRSTMPSFNLDGRRKFPSFAISSGLTDSKKKSGIRRDMQMREKGKGPISFPRRTRRPFRSGFFRFRVFGVNLGGRKLGA